MKKLIIGIIAICIVAVLLGGTGYVWWQTNTKTVSQQEDKKRFVITKGSSAEKIAQKLYTEGLIRSPLAFKLYVQLTDSANHIQAGEFTLSPDMTIQKIVQRLKQGPDQLWVTIPEGLRREEVAEKIITSLQLPDDETSSTFRIRFLELTQDKEGYLFPETYLFPRDVTPEKVVSVLTNTFETKTKDLQTAIPEGYTFDEVVILASLLERETRTNEERPTVAGIMYNRLSNNWPLQIDAAVQYAVSTNSYCKTSLKVCIPTQNDVNWWPILSRDDLTLPSRYNTYAQKGLPPAPIANAGLASLKAASQPADSDYMFYLHDSEGGIHYGRTLEDHNANIQKYLQK